MVSLPESVRIREVGPRDGFQNDPEVIPTERKVELIDALARTGLRRLEVTSFVRPDVIPQLADAAAVLDGIGARGTTRAGRSTDSSRQIHVGATATSVRAKSSPLKSRASPLVADSA